MRIGSDFEKIQWNFNGWEFLEPNAFVGDTLIFIVVMFLIFKIKKLDVKSNFMENWLRFYVVFGFGFFIGGFGHLLYNYTGIPLKLPSYYAGIIAVYFIEQAMFSIHPDPKWKRLLKKISDVKIIVALVLETIILSTVDLKTNTSTGLALPTINSVLGMGFSLGYLGYVYHKQIHSSFRFLWISTFILVPSAIFQAFKINLHPWMDRNDFSHVLLIVSVIMYYQCIKRYAQSHKENI